MMQSVLGGATSSRLNKIEQSPSAMILQDLLQCSGRLIHKDGDGDGHNANEDTFEVLKEMQKSQMSNNMVPVDQ